MVRWVGGGSLGQKPFAEKGVREAAGALADVDKPGGGQLPHDPLDGTGGHSDPGGEGIGIDGGLRRFRQRPQHRHLAGREAVDEGFVAAQFPREDEVEGRGEAGFGDFVARFRGLPERFAELLHVAGDAVGESEDAGDGGGGDFASAVLEALFDEASECDGVDGFDGEGQGGLVERAVHVAENPHHVVADAPRKEIGGVRLELNRRTHLRKNDIRPFNVENVLKLVEHNAKAFVLCEFTYRPHDHGKRIRSAGSTCIHGNLRSARVYVKRQGWPQLVYECHRLLDEWHALA